MRSQHIGYKLKGFYKTAKFATKILSMTNLAVHRSKVVSFAENNKVALAVAAYCVSASTIYRWIALYHEYGLIGLENRSRAPHSTRRRGNNWDRRIVDFIRDFRFAHNFCGENIIYPHLLKYCTEVLNTDCPSRTTIKRLISDNKESMGRKGAKKPRPKDSSPAEKVERRPAGWISTLLGACVAIDSIHLIVNGRKFYATTFIDTYSRLAFVNVSTSITSKSASNFLRSVMNLFPFKVSRVLSDNGSEFKKYFSAALKEHNVTHWRIYPGKPQHNAICERFNRTVKEDFLNPHKHLLISDPQTFYRKLADWLCWYNCERPHHGLNYNTPMDIVKQEKNSNMLWTYTNVFLPWLICYNCT